MKIGIVAAETSGDRLGAALIAALRADRPDLEVEGVAGPLMRAAGCRPLAGIEELSVMGFAEIVRHLPRLLALRRGLRRHFLRSRPDVFIGIDAPDFNLALEAALKRAGIPVVHYVSPTVWAWREGRVRTLRRAADLVLTIFPFEAPWLCDRGVVARFVGHPLADAIPAPGDRAAARARLGLPPAAPVLAVLPGSRGAELRAHLPAFVETARLVAQALPDLQVAVPVVDDAGEARVRACLARAAEGDRALRAHVYRGQSSTVLSAADAVLTASGTATIETMLAGRPMVVAYRMAWSSYLLIRALIRVPYAAMVNILAGAPLAPEFIQHRMRPRAMAAALVQWLRDPDTAKPTLARYAELADQLRCRPSASTTAAGAILELVAGRR